MTKEQIFNKEYAKDILCEVEKAISWCAQQIAP
jgi:hypothetical protein